MPAAPSPEASPAAFRDIVVTGATGYIGRHLVRHLAEQGRPVYLLGRRGFDRAQASATPVLGAVADAVGLIDHDGTPAALAEGLAKLHDPVVIHLAGLFISRHGPDDLDPLIQANLAFPCLLFEAMRIAGCRKLVNVGTAWEHGPDGRYQPVNLYASMKAATQRILDYYVEGEGFRAVTLKLLDTYGRDDPRRKLLPLLRRHARTGEVLAMTQGRQRINLTYIDDVLDALIAAAETAGTAPEGTHHACFVLGEESPTVRDLVALIVAETGCRIDVAWGAHPEHPRQPPEPWLDAPRPPGWSPRVPLAEGLRRYFGDSGDA
ncbi:nucleoside-diphosphate-sugar epimerase [Azospirillum brasilense]|nr:nucleoside-diphosphate-sugar epimerase [Azospirillum brasilense]